MADDLIAFNNKETSSIRWLELDSAHGTSVRSEIIVKRSSDSGHPGQCFLNEVQPQPTCGVHNVRLNTRQIATGKNVYVCLVSGKVVPDPTPATSN
jgi:hypothetical protein